MTGTPEALDLDALLELHAQTSKGPWEIYPGIHQVHRGRPHPRPGAGRRTTGGAETAG
jgi:hypothetical protein